MSITVKVWDLPTRIFHWALALGVFFMLASSQVGGNAMVWHFRCGYALLALLIFRLIWGIVGGKWSRFTSFSFEPKSAMRYLMGKGLPEQSIGHNPLGSWSVALVLGILLIQIATGFLSDDEISNSGPLVNYAPSAIVSVATSYHKSIGKPILLIWIAIHIAAIGFHFYKKNENLIRPMLHGHKEISIDTIESKDSTTSRVLAGVIFLVCAIVVALVVHQLG
jgi:cytochrome b